MNKSTIPSGPDRTRRAKLLLAAMAATVLVAPVATAGAAANATQLTTPDPSTLTCAVNGELVADVSQGKGLVQFDYVGCFALLEHTDLSSWMATSQPAEVACDLLHLVVTIDVDLTILWTRRNLTTTRGTSHLQLKINTAASPPLTVEHRITSGPMNGKRFNEFVLDGPIVVEGIGCDITRLTLHNALTTLH